MTTSRARKGSQSPAWPPYPFPVERYCVDSGRPVRMIPGDRCRDHAAAPRMCRTDVRPAQCEHPYPSANHPESICSECGRPILTKEAV